MYFWKVKNLEIALKNNLLSEKQKFGYFLFAILSYEFMWLYFKYNPISYVSPIFYRHPYLINQWISSILTAIIPIVGIIICYKSNRINDNVNFIERIICLSLPIGIRIFVKFALIGFIIFILPKYLNNGKETIIDKHYYLFRDIIYDSLISVNFYFNLNNSIKRVSKSNH